jgi:hypothetical protein
MSTFRHFLDQRDRPRRLDYSDPVLLVSLITHYGPAGISRKDLGKVIKMSPQLLNQLLASYCSVGFLQSFRQGDHTFYRAVACSTPSA